ncbi:hypothetical protein E2C01_073034 [Portunus trituberculatus]|uniref:Uncharacterized protein n=1 Tax=Portunus trituberculatus TaxID=210409 RepID=A0A5B7I9H3_PORTR|nr:hypothetical protein [Portunus trituberculatus]
MRGLALRHRLRPWHSPQSPSIRKDSADLIYGPEKMAGNFTKVL